MTQRQNIPWFRIGIASFLLAIAWVFGVFESPAPPRSPAPPPQIEEKPVELSPEAKAALADRKREEDAENERFARDAAAVRQLKSSMKNPASFELEDAFRMDDGTLCLSYRATNSFNAIIPGQAVITKNRVYTSDNRSSYVAQYNKLCAGKSGKRMRHLRWTL